MFCSNCGMEVPDGANVCPNCGQQLSPNVDDTIKQGAQDTFNQAEQGIRSEFQSMGNAVNNIQPAMLRTDRSLIIYILLSIITCGIYSYFFIYSIAQDVNRACDGDGNNTSGLAAFIILSFITCGFYAIYWEYAIANRLAENAPRYGMNFTENGTTVVMWHLVGWVICGIGPFIAMNIIIKNTNRICEGYNRTNGFYNQAPQAPQAPQQY